MVVVSTSSSKRHQTNAPEFQMNSKHETKLRYVVVVSGQCEAYDSGQVIPYHDSHTAADEGQKSMHFHSPFSSTSDANSMKLP